MNEEEGDMPLTEEQREIRKKGVTGSEISALVGLNPYKSPQQLWEEKLGIVEPDPSLDDNPHIERGVYLEPALIKWTEKRVGYPVWANSHTFVSRANPLVIATPDGFADPEPGRRQVLEVKAPSPRAYEDWADPDEIADGIPKYYVPQVQFEMAATDTEEALISTLIGGSLRVYRMKRSQPLIDMLVKRAEAFWWHVEHQEPPPVDFSRPIEREWLKKHLKSQESDEMREYGPVEAESIEADIKKYLELKAEADAAEEKLAETKSFLQFFVGGCAGFQTPNYKVTWKQSRGSAKTDWKRVYDHLLGTLPQHADIIESAMRACTSTTEGSRRFLVTATKKEG